MTTEYMISGYFSAVISWDLNYNVLIFQYVVDVIFFQESTTIWIVDFGLWALDSGL
jgi:hypothetical protein